MVEFEAKIFGKGRIVIPSKIRRKLGLKDGNHVRVEGLTKLLLVPEKNPKAKEGSS